MLTLTLSMCIICTTNQGTDLQVANVSHHKSRIYVLKEACSGRVTLFFNSILELTEAGNGCSSAKEPLLRACGDSQDDPQR